jgi:hypothetical protein
MDQINLSKFEGGEMPVRLAEDSHLGRAGQVVTLALYPSDVHDPTEIPTYLAGYKNNDMRADEVSPPILRDSDTDKYRTFDEDDAYLTVDVKGSINGTVPEVDPKSALSQYTVVDRFVGSFVNDITAQNATAYTPRQVAGRRCATAIGLDREIDVWTMLTDANQWHASVKATLGATQKWNGGADSDPIVDLQTRIEASLSPITDAYMNLRTAHAFINNAKVRDYLKLLLGDSGAASVLGGFNARSQAGFDFTIPGIFGVTFHIVTGKYKTASSGSPDFILGNDVVLVHKPGGVPNDGQEIATTYTFRRKGGAGVGWETREFRVEGRGPKGGVMVVVSQADIAKMTGPKVGGLIKAAYQ